jgi:hypothetical protein
MSDYMQLNFTTRQVGNPEDDTLDVGEIVFYGLNELYKLDEQSMPRYNE